MTKDKFLVVFLTEYGISLEVAKQLLISLQPVLVKSEINLVREVGSQKLEIGNRWVDFEIHIDVGEKGETRTMIQEIVGMVRAHNFEPRTKPLSFGASNVADRHC